MAEGTGSKAGATNEGLRDSPAIMSESAGASKLALYHYDGCPFCGIVRRAIDALGSEVELRNILEDRERRRELVEATGRQTVPCLRIEDALGEVRWMFESREIIAYLDGVAAA